MKNIIKVTIVIATFVASTEVAFMFGKGEMLRILEKNDTTANETIKVLSDDERLRAKIISAMAKRDLKEKL